MEDQLIALASPFGEIRSVRTFTRHVRDSESGYGFICKLDFSPISFQECQTDGFHCVIGLRQLKAWRDVLLC